MAHRLWPILPKAVKAQPSSVGQGGQIFFAQQFEDLKLRKSGNVSFLENLFRIFLVLWLYRSTQKCSFFEVKIPMTA